MTPNGYPVVQRSDHVRAGHVAVPAHRHRHELGEGVHLGGQRQDRRRVHVLAARHRQAHAEEDHAELGALHAVDQVLQLLQRQTRLRDAAAFDALALDEGAQDA